MEGPRRATTQKIAFGEVKNQVDARLFLRFQGNCPQGVRANGPKRGAISYLGVLKRLLHRIRRIRPEYREGGSWRLLHDNAPSHRSSLVTDFLTRNRISTINHHSPYSPDMAPCDFYLFGKLHLAMKGKRFASVEAIQKACTDILRDIPVNDLKHSFEKLLDRAKQCIPTRGDYFE